jgi:DNA-binding response OmpR family regulator
MIERVLGNQGYDVSTATDGVQALVLLGKQDFDLILSGGQMPTLDGFRLIEVIEQKGIKTPVIFLTAQGGGDFETRGLNLGAEDYIAKPVKKSVLLTRIKRALDRRSPSGT